MRHRLAYQASGAPAPDTRPAPPAMAAPWRALGLLALLATALALAFWAARGPNAAYLPEFAPDPLILPDGRALYAARFEVTVAEWNRCAEDGACVIALKPRPGQDPTTTPATGISWIDARDYVDWINARARFPLRLPTAGEWQAMAAPVLPPAPDPIFTDPQLSWARDYLTAPSYARALKPQGSFAANPQGVEDLGGPVWEWTSDCYEPGIDPARCPAFHAGGLHLSVISVFTRDPARGGCAVGAPPAHLGLRLVSDRAPPA